MLSEKALQNPAIDAGCDGKHAALFGKQPSDLSALLCSSTGIDEPVQMGINPQKIPEGAISCRKSGAVSFTRRYIAAFRLT